LSCSFCKRNNRLKYLAFDRITATWVYSYLTVIKTECALCILYFYYGYARYTIIIMLVYLPPYLAERRKIIIYCNIIIVAIDFSSTRKLCTISAVAVRACPKIYYYQRDVWPLGNRTVKICNRRISRPSANREWNNTGHPPSHTTTMARRYFLSIWLRRRYIIYYIMCL